MHFLKNKYCFLVALAIVVSLSSFSEDAYALVPMQYQTEQTLVESKKNIRTYAFVNAIKESTFLNINSLFTFDFKCLKSHHASLSYIAFNVAFLKFENQKDIILSLQQQHRWCHSEDHIPTRLIG